MNSHTIEKEITIHATPDLVFDMLTDSNQIIKYYPLNEVISKWELGSEVLYKGKIDNVKFTDYGIIKTLSRPSEYKYSYWSDNHGTERTPENHLTIHYMLSKEGDSTRLKLEQKNIKSDEMYQMMNTTVWDYLLNNLKKHIESNT